MSVTAINIVAQPSLEEGADGITIPVRLEAKCSAVTDGVLAVRAHASCPKRGDAYSFGGESDSSLVCTNVSIVPKPDSFGLDRSKVYSITATYSNSVPSGGLGEDEEDPLDDPPIYEFDGVKYQIPATADRDGEAVVNGADEAFDPPYMIDENRSLILITRNEASFGPAVQEAYQDTVNDAAWAGLGAGVAKINKISARMATRGEISYFVVTYEIEIKWQGWNPTGILAQGFKYRKAAGGQVENYIDPATGEPPASPILLALDGTKSPDPLGDGALPYFHEFNFYREKDFSALNLGL